MLLIASVPSSIAPASIPRNREESFASDLPSVKSLICCAPKVPPSTQPKVQLPSVCNTWLLVPSIMGKAKPVPV